MQVLFLQYGNFGHLISQESLAACVVFTDGSVLVASVNAGLASFLNSYYSIALLKNIGVFSMLKLWQSA